MRKANLYKNNKYKLMQFIYIYIAFLCIISFFIEYIFFQFIM